MICVTELRNLMFSLGILKQKQFKLPVIVVGNLSTGGTGKSPMIDYLLKLISKEKKLASLSRGYGRDSTGFYEVNNSSTTKLVGDEPLMLKQLNPNLLVFVDENRVRGIEKICATYPHTNVILLDDAFQHRFVKPGFAIVLTSFENIFYNDFILPIGNLRELRKNANRAHVIVVTKCPKLTEVQLQDCKVKIEKYSKAQVFFSTINYGVPLSLFGSQPVLGNDTDILLVTGIAQPNSLYNQCKSSYKSVNHISFGDHHSYNTNDFISIAKNFNSFASEKKIVLTTHKDAVKWLEADAKSLEIIKNIPIFYQPMQMQILNNTNEFNELILNYVRTTQPNS